MVSYGERTDMSKEFFVNKTCEQYSCHKIEDINCLFCFCPLYYKQDCGGYFEIKSGFIKDCSECLLPHYYNNYQLIIQSLRQDELDKQRLKLDES